MICAGITKAGNIITVDYVAGDAGHGNGWGDPYRYLDIFDTAISNGWLPVPSVQIGTDFRHYFFPWRITIQGADTYFLHQEEGVMIETTEYYAFYESGANFKLIISANEKSHNIIICSTNGVIRFQNDVTGSSLIQDTVINKAYRIFCSGDVTIQRSSILAKHFGNLSDGPGVTLEDITISRSYQGLYLNNNFLSAQRIKIQDCAIGVANVGYCSFDMSNLQIVNCTIDLQLKPNDSGRLVNLTDSQIDITKINKSIFAGDNDITLNLLSTFKINITNGDGGAATLYDKDGNVVATQTLSGEWEVAGKVLYYKRYYETSGGVEVEDTITEYYPFSLVVTKVGKQTLTVPGINIEPGEITHVKGEVISPIYADLPSDVEIQEPDSIIIAEQEAMDVQLSS